jgi:hypothetical protein
MRKSPQGLLRLFVGEAAMQIRITDLDWYLDDALANIIKSELIKSKQTRNDAVTLNFRDPSYSAETGGFHPVEIRLDANGEVQYVTDFSYVGYGGYEELVKELDFDFSLGLFQQFDRCYPIESAREMFLMWQQNFCAYYHMDVYQVQITFG